MGSVGNNEPTALAMEPTSLTQLAAEVAKLSESLETFLKENKLPQPTLAADSPVSYDGLTPDMFMLRQEIIDKLNDMWILAQGPSESVFNYAHTTIADCAAINVLNFFDFWSAVPLRGSQDYASIAKAVQLPLEVVERVLKHAVTLRFFAPDPSDPKNRVQHTSRSAALAQSKGLRGLVSTTLDDAGPPVLVLQEALDRYSRGKDSLTQRVDETSFEVLQSRFGGGKRYASPWEFNEQDGEGEKKGWRSRNFAEFMIYLKEIFRFEELVQGMFDWESLGPNGKVVDLGGSSGHDAVALARKFPNLTITVQDLPKVQSVFDANTPADLSSRVTFRPHSFLDPQPEPADVYLLKMILHDWPDAEVMTIFRNLVPQLKPGNRVIIVEYIGNREGSEDEDKIPRSVRQMGTATDIRIMAMFNCKERPVSEWSRLVKAADERFDIAKVKAGPHDFYCVVEAVWRG